MTVHHSLVNTDLPLGGVSDGDRDNPERVYTEDIYQRGQLYQTSHVGLDYKDVSTKEIWTTYVIQLDL